MSAAECMVHMEPTLHCVHHGYRHCPAPSCTGPECVFMEEPR